MTTLTLNRPGTFDFPDRGETTLDDLIVDAWEGLATARPVACPVCGGAMASSAGPGDALAGASAALAGRCASCGTHLS
jgi:hypothetical protein